MATPSEPPDITVRSGATEIPWIVAKNKWSKEPYDQLDTLQMIMRTSSVSELPYLKNEEHVTIVISGRVPDSFTLTEYILREDGTSKYNTYGMAYDIHFGLFNRTAEFAIKPNYATMLSSSSWDYLPGNTIKGYRLVCTWGGNMCEYAFIIRGDASLLF